MKITILAIGKKHDPKLVVAIEDYSKRLNHYTNFIWDLVEAKLNSSMSPDEIRKTESELLLSHIKPEDKVILLDETGAEIGSIENANNIHKHLNQSTKNLVFIIGGAFGVTDEVMKRADYVLSLSKLVFPHQLVRLILVEQLYRSFTILSNEKYHHE